MGAGIRMKKVRLSRYLTGRIILPLLDSVGFHRNQEHDHCSGPCDRGFSGETQEPECICGPDVHFPIT